MATSLPVGKVQTVLGPISPKDLGITLTHEHLLLDLRPIAMEKPRGAWQRAIYEAPFSQDNIGWVRYHEITNLDNYLMADIDVAIDEAMLYKRYGGGTLVEATNPDIGRDAAGLAGISQETGLHIVMGSTHYVDVAHPVEMEAWTEDDIVEEIVNDVLVGVDGTRIKSGIIGEIGCSWPLTPNERKVLKAAARAQAITGAPMLIHPGRDETSPMELIEIADKAGADLTHIIMAHIDRTVFEKETLLAIAKKGCYLEWDLFGREQHYYSHNQNIDMPNDGTKMDDIAWLIGKGYEDQIVVAHDICTKDRWMKYGGHGYHYLLSQIMPRMRTRGYTDVHINKLFKDNPQKVLTFRAPTNKK